MPCQGFAADIYDLYVLGLLEGKERADLEAHLARDCEVCRRNVRRSLDLWVVFASTLQGAEPSPDFRARLVRIAELSKKAPVFPRPVASPSHGKFAWTWGWMVVAGIVVMMLIAGAWFAGHESASIEAQRLSAQLNQLSNLAADRQVLLDEATRRETEFEGQLKSAGDADAMRKREETRREILALDAEVNEYKSLLSRQKSAENDSQRLLNVLSHPGVRLLALKGADIAKQTAAYALIAEASRVIFIAANLPALPKDKQFQLWLLRSQDPKIVNAGTFIPDDQDQAMVEFSDPTEVSDLTGVAVTDEPKSGSLEPTGTKLLVGTIAAEVDVVK
ncbi:MAG TPA: anti-sigma factor [Bryobacteraceae bacterium]|jgi:anti-sigma-K factor RskA|nr:anti-sigma factor [Bryobacteraceae bacterium]